MKTSRILITGASGFVGANITRALLANHHNVHIILRKEANTWRINDILPHLTVHTLDLSQKEKLKLLMQTLQPEYIFHFAAHGAYSFQTNLDEMVKINVVALSNLLEASKDIPYKCFVNTGSSSEYGYKQKPMKETDFLEPDSFYAATKSAGTLLSQVYARQYKKPLITFRLFSVFGPYEDPSRLIPTAIQAALTGKTLKLTPGVIKRDFIYINDVISAYLTVMKKKVIPGDVFNIGTGRQASNDDIATIIKKINMNKLDINKGAYPLRSWDTKYWVAYTKHAKDTLQWQSNYSLKKGLEETYEWFRLNSKKYQNIYGKI